MTISGRPLSRPEILQPRSQRIERHETMARKLSPKAEKMAELARKAQESVPQTGDNPKALDTEGATPTVTMGGILLMRKLYVGDKPLITQEEMGFLHLWVSETVATKAGRKEMARIARQSPEDIVDLFYDWMFTVDFMAVQDKVMAIGESLQRVAENSEIMDASSEEIPDTEDDGPNAVG